MSKHWNKPFDPTKPVIICPGPTSDIGKQTASRNSLKHGCCATDVLIMPTENIEDYKALENTWFRAYEPMDEAEKHLVKELINADWFLQRATRTVARLEAFIFEAVENPLFWNEEHHRSMSRFLRYQTTRSNTVKRCQKALEDYRKNRTAEKQAEEKAILTKERHALYMEKNKPEPSIEEILETMMQKKANRDLHPPDSEPGL